VPAPSGSFGGHGANGRRLVVEVDGDAVHSSRSSFERGRRRDAELHAGGSRVIRVTWRRITVERDALVATLALATARP
jgi:very-short-patch-repair endonuclease